MNEINEIKIPQGVESISVTQHDDKVVIEFMPKEPQFKNGDFVYEDGRIMIVNGLSEKRVIYHALIYPAFDLKVVYNYPYALKAHLSSLSFRYATDEEKQILIDAMEKEGKRWNAEKLIVEDIPKPKFKVGDPVKIKEGISSKTHRYASCLFLEEMDKYIGKKLTVKEYIGAEYVEFYEDYYGYRFHEDWLEPYTEELKNGDLVIAWNNDMSLAVIGIKIDRNPAQGCKHVLNNNNSYKHAIKFESKEQFEKVLRGEI